MEHYDPIHGLGPRHTVYAVGLSHQNLGNECVETTRLSILDRGCGDFSDTSTTMAVSGQQSLARIRHGISGEFTLKHDGKHLQIKNPETPV